MKEINQNYFADASNTKYINRKYKIKDYERKLSSIDELIIHCTATDSPGWDDPIACINYDMNPNHISRNGCPTATYHFYINKQGDIYQLVSMNVYTWNCAGHNRNSVAICINHKGANDIVKKAQYDSLIETICYVFDKLDWGYDEWGVKERLYFHRDHNPNKACPGNLDKKKVMKDVIKKLETWGDKE